MANEGLKHLTHGNYKWVIVSFDGKLCTSSDGINWTIQSFDIIWRSSFYANNRFIAVGINTIAVSQDAINWTIQNIPGNWRHVNCQNNQWIAVGDEGKIATSLDNGVNWNVQDMDIYIFSVDVTSLPYAAGGEGKSITVTSTRNGNAETWSVTSKPDWITISGSTFTSSENTGDARSGSIVLTQNNSGNTVSISVTQEAGVLSKFIVVGASGNIFNIQA
jgi:hypothetical protein